jgi:hypothetical protein
MPPSASEKSTFFATPALIRNGRSGSQNPADTFKAIATLIEYPVIGDPYRIYDHTVGVHLTALGIDVVTIRDLLGHASLETTNLYASQAWADRVGSRATGRAAFARNAEATVSRVIARSLSTPTLRVPAWA